MKVPIADIKIGPRFWKELGDIGPLVDSIKRHGLLHPVVITADRELICGARRIEACRKIGFTDIEAHQISLNEASPTVAEADEVGVGVLAVGGDPVGDPAPKPARLAG